MNNPNPMTIRESPEQTATRAMLKTQAAETGDRMLLELYLRQMESIGSDVFPPPTNIEDPAARARLFATPPGADYFDEQLLPPPELFRFLGEANVGNMSPREIATTEREVVDWCTKQYNPPPHLGFHLDFSEALVAAGMPAPLGLWLTRRAWCSEYWTPSSQPQRAVRRGPRPQ